ncbi:hypothetical protein FBR43_05160 [Sphingomonas baiyangensis]|uniref:Phage head morphogenesis domain-containing protein n=1 Tax=Sphingomonas baiyangensis TaxID=2572576 RepID=A0A4U1L597_9SPHN|nr:hypothetical protein FBR43_05160 [Sphingomonas baiyangensis]
MVRRQRNVRRRAIPIRDIAPPATLASSLYASYSRVVQLWQRRAERIIAEYERTVDSMTTDSPADIQGEIEQAQSEFERLFLDIVPELHDWVIRTEAWTRGQWRGAVLSATGVDLSTLLGPEDVRDTLESYIAWNTDLIRDVSAQTRKRIGDRIFSGLTERKPAREVAREIREAVAMSRDRSLRVASDQLSKLTSNLAAERRREAGLSVFEWRHSRKRHPRTEHQARDGNYYSEDPALVGKRVDGKTIRADPPRGDRAGMPPFCGCRERSVLVFSFDGEG